MKAIRSSRGALLTRCESSSSSKRWKQTALGACSEGSSCALSTSIGANVHEAQAGQSRADFVAKMSIAHKEAREAAYWLRLIEEAHLLPAESLSDIADETRQLIKILSSILLSAKRRGS